MTRERPDNDQGDAAEPTATVYRKRMAGGLLASLLFGLLAIIVVAHSANRKYLIGALIGLAFGLVFPALECRRAIILSRSEFVSKGISGDPLRIPFEEIGALQEVSTFYMMGPWPMSVPAVRITLRSGTAHTVPLDFPHREEILAKLRGAMGGSTQA